MSGSLHTATVGVYLQILPQIGGLVDKAEAHCRENGLPAAALLDKTREAMAERRLVNRATDMPFGRITFSGGVADIFAHTTPRDALKAADDALYAAKAAGRNCIVKDAEAARAAA